MNTQLTRSRTSVVWCIVFSVSFVLLAFFYYCIPMTIDDYFWGGEDGIRLLKSFFYDYNGRYLGNMLVILLTRFKIVRVIVMPVILIALCSQMSRFIAKKRNYEYYTASLLLLFGLAFIPEIKIFSQTIAWTSGFSNYVTVTLLLVMYLNLVDTDIKNPRKAFYKKRELLMACVLGLISCLFMENITIACLLLGVTVNLYYIINRKFLNKRHLFYSFGTFLGALLMFTNSSYLKVFAGEYNDGRVSGFRQFGLIDYTFTSKELIVFLFIVFFILTAVLFPLIIINIREIRIEIYSILLLIVFSTFPLLFTNGGTIKYLTSLRIYFPQITLGIIIYLVIIRAIQGRLKFYSTALSKRVKAVLTVACLCAYVFVMIIYFNIHIVENNMEKHLVEQVRLKKETVEIITFPDYFGKYIHEMNSYSLGWDREFKSFYSIDKNVELEFISFEDYLNDANS